MAPLNQAPQEAEMRKIKQARLTVFRETLKRLDLAENEVRQAAGGAVNTRNNCTTVTFTNWPTCDPFP
jgi:hypothetical protein